MDRRNRVTVHPLFEKPRRLALYLCAWLCVAVLLGCLLAAAGGMSARAAALQATLLCLAYAALLLPVWYTCRAVPLAPGRTPRAVATHLCTAALAGGLWMLCAAALDRVARPAATPPPAALLRLLFGLGVLLYLATAAGCYLALAVAASRAAEARVLQSAVLAREAELRALKAQVNPHFLFNSLNSIAALATLDPARAREMCVLLGDFLRRTLAVGERAAIPLADELALVHAFLAVEKIRYGARLRIDETVAPAAAAALVPPLLLQPLVENAVAHGIATLVAGGAIRLDVACRDGLLGVTVENDYDPESPPYRGGGLGLANVRGRLAARYGPAARLQARAGEGRFRVELMLPLEPAPRAAAPSP